MTAIHRHLEVSRIIEQYLDRLMQIVQRTPIFFVVNYHAFARHRLNNVHVELHLVGGVSGLQPVIRGAHNPSANSARTIHCPILVDETRALGRLMNHPEHTCVAHFAEVRKPLMMTYVDTNRNHIILPISSLPPESCRGLPDTSRRH